MFVVTGTGRCGTSFVAELLNRLGIKTGHESVFTADGLEDPEDYDGDVSAFAAPHLCGEDGPAVLLVREPIACVTSIYGQGGFWDPANYVYQQAVRDYLAIDDLGPSPRAEIEYWRQWNDMAAKHANLILRIEDFPRAADPLVRVLGRPMLATQAVLAASGMMVHPDRPGRNHRPPRQVIELDSSQLEPLREAGKVYGY